MTAQPEAFQPAFNLSLTHVGLTPTGLENVHQRGKEVEITFATTRVVLLALNATDRAGIGPVQDYLGWPRWNAPGVPEPSNRWKAIFSIKSRALEGLYCATADQGQPTVVRLPVPSQVTDPMWQMLRASNSVVLCVGLAGDPSAAELAAAGQQGKLHAVLAEALLH